MTRGRSIMRRRVRPQGFRTTRRWTSLNETARKGTAVVTTTLLAPLAATVIVVAAVIAALLRRKSDATTPAASPAPRQPDFFDGAFSLANIARRTREEAALAGRAAAEGRPIAQRPEDLPSRRWIEERIEERIG